MSVPSNNPPLAQATIGKRTGCPGLRGWLVWLWNGRLFRAAGMVHHGQHQRNRSASDGPRFLLRVSFSGYINRKRVNESCRWLDKNSENMPAIKWAKVTHIAGEVMRSACAYRSEKNRTIFFG